MLLMQRGVRLRCLPWSVALTFCARLHLFLMFFCYFLNGAALGSPCLDLALGLPYELVCKLFQYFLVILASKASPMQRGARLVRSFIHFSTAFCLLRTPTVIDCRPPTLGASLSLCARLYTFPVFASFLVLSGLSQLPGLPRPAGFPPPAGQPPRPAGLPRLVGLPQTFR